MKTLSLILLCFIFCSCAHDPLENKVVNNPEFKVQFLFSVDSCNVYRFEDGGRYIYIITPHGEVRWFEHHSSGKTSHTEHYQSMGY